MFDPAKQNRYHLVIQWEAVPDYDIAVAGLDPPTDTRVYKGMEKFGDGGRIERRMLKKLVYDRAYIERLVSRSTLVRKFVTRRTRFPEIQFDRNCNNIVIFEGTYSPKCYLRDWKETNGLIFVLLINDVSQFNAGEKYNISISPYDHVISYFPPPEGFLGIVDRISEQACPAFDFSWLRKQVEERFPDRHGATDGELDLFFAAASTPFRDRLALPFCEAVRAAGLKSFLVYSGLKGIPDEFPLLKHGFPDSSRFLTTIENAYFTRISNCLLELHKMPPPYPVDRFQKAVMYNKKYVGHNPAVRSSPFYNPDWMRIITTPDEITPELMEWIRTKEEVDYGYDGRWDFGNTVIKCVKEVVTSIQDEGAK